MASKEQRVFVETCTKCGDEFERPPGRRRGVCYECGAANLVEASTQLRDKAGPLYEKAVRKQLMYWRTEATRLGIRV